MWTITEVVGGVALARLEGAGARDLVPCTSKPIRAPDFIHVPASANAEYGITLMMENRNSVFKYEYFP